MDPTQTGLSWSLRRHVVGGTKPTYRYLGDPEQPKLVPVALCDRTVRLYSLDELRACAFSSTELDKPHPTCKRCAARTGTETT